MGKRVLSSDGDLSKVLIRVDCRTNTARVDVDGLSGLCPALGSGRTCRALVARCCPARSQFGSGARASSACRGAGSRLLATTGRVLRPAVNTVCRLPSSSPAESNTAYFLPKAPARTEVHDSVVSRCVRTCALPTLGSGLSESISPDPNRLETSRTATALLRQDGRPRRRSYAASDVGTSGGTFVGASLASGSSMFAC